MIGLIDVNNFYASCERVFDPSLFTRPVVVLSNNDGCIIARSQEVKDMQIKMGTPYFQVKHQLQQAGAAVFSSNYTLYGDMSSRVMSTLGQLSDEIEVYSIDEAFVSLSPVQSTPSYVQGIRQRVRQNLGLPVGIGVSLTKTLAKVANHLAKKDSRFQSQGVCVLSEGEVSDELSRFPIEQVWGIGRQYATWLHTEGITTAGAFTNLSRSVVRSRMSVVGERIWRELRGEPCLELDMLPSRRKSICTSRTFNRAVILLGKLKEPVSTFASRCAYKLRKERSLANLVTIFLQTDPHRPDQPPCSQSVNVPLSFSTSNSFEIVRAALFGLEQLCQEGYRYRKAGIILGGIVPEYAAQADLFSKPDPRQEQLTHLMDTINQRYGSGALRLASEGGQQESWHRKAHRCSPRYSTRFSEIPRFKA